MVVTSLSGEHREARFVVEQIEKWVQAGRRLAEVAVLYRSNAQSRLIEEALASRQIPYRVYGGLRFFERAVIKDALAYLRLACYADDPSFSRVVNQPPRGLGARTVDLIRGHAQEHEQSLYAAALSLLNERSCRRVQTNPCVLFTRCLIKPNK